MISKNNNEKKNLSKIEQLQWLEEIYRPVERQYIADIVAGLNTQKKQEDGSGGIFSLAPEMTNQQLAIMTEFLVKKSF